MSTMFKSGGIARSMALLFALVSFLGLCAAVPTPPSDVAARANLKDVQLVRMGQTMFLPLVKGKKYGSYGFDSCIGVLIYGKDAALLGHYSCSARSIADTGDLTGIDVHAGAATHAIPAALAGKSLGTGIKSYIFAQDGTAPERELKTYKKTVGEQGAGFTVDVGKYLGTNVDWQFS